MGLEIAVCDSTPTPHPREPLLPGSAERPGAQLGWGTFVLPKAGDFCVKAAGALAQAPGYLILGEKLFVGKLGMWTTG